MKDYSGILAGFKSDIRHLHSLGLVRKDINPSNVMFDGDKLVIILRLILALVGLLTEYGWA
jgi:serine/threonine protein kinase